jgi:hypothetical protein
MLWLLPLLVLLQLLPRHLHLLQSFHLLRQKLRRSIGSCPGLDCFSVPLHVKVLGRR